MDDQANHTRQGTLRAPARDVRTKMKMMLKIAYWACLLVSACVVLWFGSQADGFGLMFYAWPISVAVVVNLLAASAFAAPRLSRQCSPRLQFGLLPFVISAAIIAYALMNEHGQGPLKPNAATPIWIVLALQLVLVVILAAITRGYRWLVLSIGLCSLWTSCSVGFIGIMMVTGDWI